MEINIPLRCKKKLSSRTCAILSKNIKAEICIITLFLNLQRTSKLCND